MSIGPLLSIHMLWTLLSIHMRNVLINHIVRLVRVPWEGIRCTSERERESKQNDETERVKVRVRESVCVFERNLGGKHTQNLRR